MVLIHAGLAFVLSLSCTFAADVQNNNLLLPPDAPIYKQMVTDIFLESYNAYREFAFGHDDLSPLTQGFSDPLNGWGASVVDALDTLYIMGSDDLFTEAVNFASNIDYSTSKTPNTVSVFETTIRHVGGLLSAYELSGQQFPSLVQKAKEVADKLAFAWVGHNVVPFGFVNFTDNSPTITGSNIAEAGTLTLEWSTLANFTGNQTYADLTVGSVQHIAGLSDPLPGLAAQGIDPSTGKSIDGYVTWGGGSDSYFEYLIKYARLSNTDDPLFADTWHTAVDSSIRFLERTSTVGNHVYLADFDDSRSIRHIGSHLACFYGGNWIFGGRLLNNDTIFNIGLELVDACWNTYASTETGIGPEAFAFISADGNFTGGSKITPAQQAFYNQNGFYITDSVYIQRPEVLESNFYAWRATGDPKYISRAASAVDSFNRFLKTPTGFAGTNDVNNMTSSLIDDTESFWFGEVLKYLYLTFDDPNHISLNDYVFNTEAHPFKAPPAKSTYGTNTILPSKPFTVQSGPPLPVISPSRFNRGTPPH